MGDRNNQSMTITELFLEMVLPGTRVTGIAAARISKNKELRKNNFPSIGAITTQMVPICVVIAPILGKLFLRSS